MKQNMKRWAILILSVIMLISVIPKERKETGKRGENTIIMVY